MPAGKVEEKDLLPLRSCTSVPLASSFILHPPPSPRAHTLSRPDPREFLRRFFLVDTALAACLEHLPPLDFNPICLSTPSNPSGYLLGSLAENFSSDHLRKFNIFFFFLFLFFLSSHNERFETCSLFLFVSRDESTFVTNYITRYAVSFFSFHRNIFLIHCR